MALSRVPASMPTAQLPRRALAIRRRSAVSIMVLRSSTGNRLRRCGVIQEQVADTVDVPAYGCKDAGDVRGGVVLSRQIFEAFFDQSLIDWPVTAPLVDAYVAHRCGRSARRAPNRVRWKRSAGRRACGKNLEPDC